ncbi:MAG: hypothetical protein HOE11_02595 [Candidatus Diapherotrites archaeon]|jgi:hypothetical protein|nr:hypothetical protein [Candidatus Diapherotrites archaeon]MBT4597066.1 hypothetical protein [Candidatus Diapherotrites archaeon]
MPRKIKLDFLKEERPEKFFTTKLKKLAQDNQKRKATQLRTIANTLYERSTSLERETINLNIALDDPRIPQKEREQRFRELKKRIKKHNNAVHAFAKHGKKYFETFEVFPGSTRFSDNPVEALTHAAWRKLSTLNRFVLSTERRLR